MDRRYYALKGLLLGIAVIAAAWCGALACPRLSIAHNPHYQAVVLEQGAIREAGARLARNVSHFFNAARAGL